MPSHEDILHRMDGANPLPDVEMITDGQLAELSLQIEEARRSDPASGQPERLVPVRPRVRWRRPAVAFAAAMLIAAAVVGAVSLTTGGESEVGDRIPTTTATTTVDLSRQGWNPVLATVVAGPTLEAAACPPGSDPDQPGPDSQERPRIGSAGLLSAAFDARTGQVIYVDAGAATWAFDVCTNSWANLRPSGAPTGNISGGLIYDVDSDVTVSIEADEIFVYDAASNTWENRVNTGSLNGGPLGVAYDPGSGLIITSSPHPDDPGSDDWFIKAYDVDADMWLDLGIVPLPRMTPCCTGIDLLGYSVELDRLVLATYIDEQEATLLLDPRTGEMSTHITPTPVVNLGWPSRSYGHAAGTVIVHSDDVAVNGRWADVLCAFDPAEVDWSRCYTSPDEFPALKHDSFDAIVDDPINHRLLLIGGTFNTFSASPPGIEDVWAIDLETAEWTRVIASTDAPSPVPAASGE